MVKKIIYADNAATTKLNKKAYDAMQPYLLNEYANPSSLYSLARSSKKALKEARTMVASAIGANPSEIIFTSCGTESNNWAIKGVAFSHFNAGKNIIVSSIEHHAILNSCAFLENLGFKVTYLPVAQNGIVFPEVLERSINDDTVLVSIMLANNELGTIQPIYKLSQIAHAHGALFHTDAVQAVGHIPINVGELGIDMLSASAHKFNGPKGVGFMYLREGVRIIPYMSGGSQEKQLRSGTENIANIVGMAVALKENIDNLEEYHAYTKQLSEKLIEKVKASPLNVYINGDENKLPGILNLSIKDCDGEAILHKLDLMGIEISTGSACNSINTKISHVIKAIGLPSKYANGTIRISLNHENTIEDVDRIANALIIASLGKE